MSAANLASFVYSKLSGSGALIPGSSDMNSLSRSTSPNPKLTAVWRTKPPRSEDIPSSSPTFKEDGSLLRLLRTKSMPSLMLEKGSSVRQTAPVVLSFSPTAKIDTSASLDQSASSSLASPITSRHLNPRRNLEESDFLESSTNTSIATPPSSPKGFTTSPKKLTRSVSDGHIIRRRRQQLRGKTHDFPPGGMPSVKSLRLRFDTGQEIDSQDSLRFSSANQGSFSITNKTVQRSYNKMENKNEEPVKTTLNKDEEEKQEPTKNKELFRHESLGRFEPQGEEVETKSEVIDVSQRSVKSLLKKFERTFHPCNDDEIIQISQRQSRPLKRSAQLKPFPVDQSSPTHDQEVELDTTTSNGDPEEVILRQRSKSLPVSNRNMRNSIANIPKNVQKLKMQFEKQTGPTEEVPPLKVKMREKEEFIPNSKEEANLYMLSNAAQRGGTELKKQASFDRVPETKEDDVQYQKLHENTPDIESPMKETNNQENEQHTPKSPSVQNLRKHFESPTSPQLTRKTDKRERPVRRRHTIALTVKEFEKEAKFTGETSLQQTNLKDAGIEKDLRPQSSVKSLLRQFELQPSKDKASDLVFSKTRNVSETALIKGESLVPTHGAVKPLAREESLIKTNASELLTELKDEDSDEEFYDESGISLKLKAKGSLDYGERALPMVNTSRGFLNRNYTRTESSSDEYSSDHEPISTRIEKDDWRAKKLLEHTDIQLLDRDVTDIEKRNRGQAERETTQVQKVENITSHRDNERIALIQAEEKRKALEFERIQKEEAKIRQMREKEGERAAREKADYERKKRDKIELKERERAEQNRKEKERAEQERREKENVEQEREERKRLEQIARERKEQEQREKERLERDWREKEKEFEGKEQERKENEAKDRAIEEQMKKDQENQRRKLERREKEREELEEKRKEKEKAKLDREKHERTEKERADIERKEREKSDQEKMKKIEQGNLIREKAEREVLEKENIELEGQEQNRQGEEEKERNVREQTKREKEDQERMAKEKLKRIEEEKQRAIQMERDNEMAEKARLQRDRETEELTKKHKVGKLVDKFTTFQGTEDEIKIVVDLTKSQNTEKPDFKVGELIEKFVNIKEEKIENENSEELQVKKTAPIPTVSAKNVQGKVRNLNPDEFRFFNQGVASFEPFVRSQSLRAKKNEQPAFHRGGSLRVKSPEPHQAPASPKNMPKSCRQLRPDELRFFAMTNNNIYSTKKAADKSSQPRPDFRLRSQDDRRKRPTVSPGDDQGHEENTDSDSDSDTSLLRDYDHDDESTDEALMFREHLDLSTTPYHEDDEEDDEALYSSLTTMDSVIKGDSTPESSMNFNLSKISATSKQSMDEIEHLDSLSNYLYEGNDSRNNTRMSDSLRGNTDESVNFDIKPTSENPCILPNEPKTSTPISSTTNIVKTDYDYTNEITKEDSIGDEDNTDDDIGLLDDVMLDLKDDLQQHQKSLLERFHQDIQVDVNRSRIPNSIPHSHHPEGLQSVLESIGVRASPIDDLGPYTTPEGVVDQDYSQESSTEENFEGTDTKPIEDYFLYIDESKEYLSDKEFGVFCLLVALLSIIIYLIYDYFF